MTRFLRYEYKILKLEGKPILNHMKDKVDEAATFLESRLAIFPKIAVITGTGLGEAVGPINDPAILDYDQIPHFPVSTVVSHTGRIVAGVFAGHPVMVLQGRFHLYEGYDPKTVTFPIRVMRKMGVGHLILSNAAGGMNPAFRQGDLMVIDDHINLTGENPLIGANEDDWGPRFPDMTAAYNPNFRRLCKEAAEIAKIPVTRGIYAGLKGPSLETPAEVRFLRTIGADAVGFSTVMETIAAVHAGIKVLGISTITNTIDPDRPKPASVEEVVTAANAAAPRLNRLIGQIVARLHQEAVE